ncbi:unnamed protein product [Lampetra fluviatilis]
MGLGRGAKHCTAATRPLIRYTNPLLLYPPPATPGSFAATTTELSACVGQVKARDAESWAQEEQSSSKGCREEEAARRPQRGSGSLRPNTPHPPPIVNATTGERGVGAAGSISPLA